MKIRCLDALEQAGISRVAWCEEKKRAAGLALPADCSECPILNRAVTTHVQHVQLHGLDALRQ